MSTILATGSWGKMRFKGGRGLRAGALGKGLVLAGLMSAFMAFSSSAYTAAVGGEFALAVGNGLPNSALLSFRLARFAPVFGLGLSIPGNGEQSSFVLLSDWWLASGPLVGILNYYVGPGVFLGISNSIQLGLRVPIGVNLFPIQPLELFLELAPALYILDSSGSIRIPNFGLQSGLGFRFWF